MIKWPITYTDFDDVEHTEEHYFHLTKSELIEMELAGGASGLGKSLEQIVASGDNGRIFGSFRDIILAAYGLREGSAKFVKNDALKAEFRQSLAFDALLQDLATNDANAVRFIQGVVPKDLVEHMDVNVNHEKATPAVVTTGSTGPTEEELDKLTGLKNPRGKGTDRLPWAFREPTDKELAAMTREQLLDVSRRQGSGWRPQAL